MMFHIGSEFSSKLYIGPQYKNHRGGIGAVLSSYADRIDGFKFIPTHDGRYGNIRNIGIFIVSIFRLLWMLTSDRSIKIIHIHGASRGSFVRKYFVFLITKFLFKKKVVYHLHGGAFHLFYRNTNPIIRRLVKHLAESTDVFICLSTYWKNYLLQQFNIRYLAIVNNPVLTLQRPVQVCEKEGENILKMLFLGRINNGKGIFDLIEVINKYKQEWSGNIKLRVGGDGEVDRLRKFIETQSLSTIIEYVGWVDGEEKHNLLSQCDVLILPSYNEGLPISILEAMSYGKAIISTIVGGIPEVVRHNENGILVEPGDRNGIADILNKFIQDPQLVRNMGERSKLYIQPYLVDNVLTQLNSIYNHESLG